MLKRVNSTRVRVRVRMQRSASQAMGDGWDIPRCPATWILEGADNGLDTMLASNGASPGMLQLLWKVEAVVEGSEDPHFR